MKDDFKKSERGDVLGNATVTPNPTLTVDVEKYQAYLDSSDMTEAQKEEFLQALWSILVSFVELGFGVHPLQEVCGKDHQTEALSPQAEFNRLGLSQEEDKLDLSGLIARLEAE